MIVVMNHSSKQKVKVKRHQVSYIFFHYLIFNYLHFCFVDIVIQSLGCIKVFPVALTGQIYTQEILSIYDYLICIAVYGFICENISDFVI